MSNTIEQKTVREIALKNPTAARVFESRRIDYCCGGGRSLADACAAAGANVEEVLAALEATPHDETAVRWQDRRMGELIDHILAVHHEHDRRELDRLRALSTKVASAHGERHRELGRVRTLVFALGDEVEPHMMKEERVLFPFIRELEASLEEKSAPPKPFFGTVANPVRMMMNDHGRVGEILADLRAITQGYALPNDACASYTALYRALDELERDLHTHIHLENNVLFPRAMRAEQHR